MAQINILNKVGQTKVVIAILLSQMSEYPNPECSYTYTTGYTQDVASSMQSIGSPVIIVRHKAHWMSYYTTAYSLVTKMPVEQ